MYICFTSVCSNSLNYKGFKKPGTCPLCEKELIEVDESVIQLINLLPFPIAYSWYMSINPTINPLKRVNNMIFTVYQVMRIYGLIMLSDYLESEGTCLELGKPLSKMRMPHWQEWITLSDTLAKYLSGAYKDKYLLPKGLMFDHLSKNWIGLRNKWKSDKTLAPGFKTKEGLLSPLELFQKLRNDRAHRQGILFTEGSELNILDRYLPLLNYLLQNLFDKFDITIVRLPFSSLIDKENLIRNLDYGLNQNISLIPIKGVHADFKFNIENFELTENLQDVLKKSSVAAIYGDKVLPIYPFFICIDLENIETLSGLTEPVSIIDSFSEKKTAYLGVIHSGLYEGIGSKIVELLNKKNHQLGLTKEESNTWLMVEWARDNALTTIQNLTLKKYFPLCYINRKYDDLLESYTQLQTKCTVIAGEAGSGKSSILCRFVENLIMQSEEMEDKKERNKIFQGKVQNKDLSRKDVLDEFMSPKESGDVIIFISGGQDLWIESGESIEKAFCRTLLKYCGVKDTEFNSPIDFIKRLNENMTALDSSFRKDTSPDRKVWIILDAVNEINRFNDFVVWLDNFIGNVLHTPGCELFSLRKGSMDAIYNRLKILSIQNRMPFTDKKVYHYFINDYPSEEIEEPFMYLPSFTFLEAEEAYVARQKNLPDRSAKLNYSRLKPEIKELLCSPLYLHIFHETFNGKSEGLDEIFTENALFEQYIKALIEEYSSVADTFFQIGNYLYENETPILHEDEAWKMTEKWMHANHYNSVEQICSLTPIEFLVSASILIRQTDNMPGYQFSHQKICEQVLKLILLETWKKHPQKDNELISFFTKWCLKSEGFTLLAYAIASIVESWTHTNNAKYLKYLPQIDAECPNSLYIIYSAIFMALFTKVPKNEYISLFLLSAYSNLQNIKIFRSAYRNAYKLAINTSKTQNVQDLLIMILDILELEIQKYPDNIDLMGDIGECYNNLGYLSKDLGESSKALEFFQKAKQKIEELSILAPQNVDYKLNLWSVNKNLGAIYMKTGDGLKAILHLLDSLTIMENLIQKNPENLEYSHNISLSYVHLGHFYEGTGEVSKSFEYFNKQMVLLEKLVFDNPESSESFNLLSANYNNLGNIYLIIGDIQKAKEYFDKSIKVIEDLVKSEPLRTDFKIKLSGAYSNTGKIYKTLNDNDKSLFYYEKAYKTVEELVKMEPQRTDIKRDFSVCNNNLGNIYKTNKDLDNALLYYKKSRDIMNVLVEIEPQRSDFQQDLAICYNNMGNIYKLKGENEQALNYYKKDLELMKSLMEAETHRTDIKRDLTVSYGNIGNIYKASGEIQKAIEYYNNSLQIMEELVEMEPQRMDYKSDLAINYWNMFRICKEEDKNKYLSNVYNLLLKLKEKDLLHDQLNQLWNMVNSLIKI